MHLTSKCMHYLITQASLPIPPQPVGPLNHPNTQQLLPGTGTIMDFDGNTVPSFFTYGFVLAQLTRSLDITLRNLLLRCMADIPADRPSLEELLRYVQWKEASWTDQSYEAARAFANTCFNEPPSASESSR